MFPYTKEYRQNTATQEHCTIPGHFRVLTAYVSATYFRFYELMLHLCVHISDQRLLFFHSFYYTLIYSLHK